MKPLLTVSRSRRIHPLRCSLLACAVIICMISVRAEEISLIPAKAQGPGYDYFCTWAVQNYLFGQGRASLTAEEVLKANFWQAHLLMHEDRLTETGGWLSFFPEVREDLWFLVDDGYQIKNGNDTMEIDPAKFPSCTGGPEERLMKLSEIVKKAGWRGLGLWSRGIRPEAEARQRVLWSKAAGVGYWKVDLGDTDKFSYVSYRNELYPELVLEHAQGEQPFNNHEGIRVGPNYPATRRDILRHSDVLRIYDADQPLNQTTSLDRVASLLTVASGDAAAKGIINCEDNVTIGAALGCSFGVFRFPYVDQRPSGDPEIYLAGPHQSRRRMDDVTRAVFWHRLAPPFAANGEPVLVDNLRLADTYDYKLGDSWVTFTGIRSQSAPARVSRGLPLPEVTAWDSPPFVISSRNPGGAVSIATLGRINPGKSYVIPLAEVRQKIGPIPSAIGIFGVYKRLILQFDVSLDGLKILAQDLKGKRPTDITGDVTIKGGELSIPGEIIQKIGLSAATPGDLSDPGLVVVIRSSSLTTGKVATASSSFNGSDKTPDKAIDLHNDSRWESEWSDAQWLAVDLGHPTLFDHARIRWDAAHAKSYDLQVGDDGQNWTTVYTNTDSPGGVETFSFKPVKARRVRLQLNKRATQWGYSIYNFDLFAPEAE